MSERSDWRLQMQTPHMIGRTATSHSASLKEWHGARAAYGSLTEGERLLRVAGERALSQPRDRSVLVLHLSRLTPPAPRSYHIRIARVLMQDYAARFDGQVFAMRNQDLVLLCRNGGSSIDRARRTLDGSDPVERTGEDHGAGPGSLPSMLGKLFSADADPAMLTSFWRLDRDAPLLLSYLAEHAGGVLSAEARDEQCDAVFGLAALQGILAKARLNDLISQRTGMLLRAERSRVLADRLVPAFREIEISLEPLNLGPLVNRATADPFLLRHLTCGLEARIVALLHDDLVVHGPLTRASIRGRLPLHVKLGPEMILSPGFAHLARQATLVGVRLGASISLMQLCADLELMKDVRRTLTLLEAELVVADVDAVGLTMVRSAELRSETIKLSWSPVMAGSDGGRLGNQTGTLPRQVTSSQLVLQNANSYDAVAWGQAQGISRFQGLFLDQVQTATRMALCPDAGGCTMRQCGTRAAAGNMASRAGCHRPELLDSGHHASQDHSVLCS